MNDNFKEIKHAIQDVNRKKQLSGQLNLSDNISNTTFSGPFARNTKIITKKDSLLKKSR